MEIYVCPECGHTFAQGEYDYNYNTALLDFKCPECEWEGNENQLISVIKNRLVEYLKDNINKDDIERALGLIDKCRCPLYMADEALYDQIRELVQDFADGEGFSNDFCDLYDIEDLFDQL